MRLLSVIITAALLVSCSRHEEPFILASSEVGCTIAVDLGGYADALQAAGDCQSVDWFDDDPTDDDICRCAFAALELQQHLAQLLGVSTQHLPIVDDADAPNSGSVIFIGAPKRANDKAARMVRRRRRKNRRADQQSFRFDSFNHKSRRGLVISGASTAVLYGVYELLERWGVRWYTPEDGAEITQIPHIEISNLHEFVAPSFAYRGFWIDAQRPADQAEPALVQWLGRNWINIFRHQEADIAALKLRGVLLNTGSRQVITSLMSPDRPYRYNHPIHQQDNHLPTDPYLPSELYQGDRNHDGVLSYGEAHPDWFAVQIDSNRSLGSVGAAPFCLSQPEALREFCRLAVDELSVGGWRQCDILDLWAPEAWCNCPKCRKLGNSADKLLFVLSAMAQHIEEAYAKGTLKHDVRLFGYGRSDEHIAPTVALPQNRSNRRIVVFLSNWPRCYAHHIISTECININLWFIKELLGWLNGKSAYHGPLGIMEHYNDDAFSSLPTLFSGVMNIDIPAYAELGVTGLSFLHARTHDLGINALLNYQYARQTRHSNTDVEDLRNDFIKFLYPDAAPEMRDYYTSMEKCLSTLSTFTYFMPQRAPLLMEAMRADSTNRRVLVNEQFDWQRNGEEPNFNSQWENSYQRIHEARYLLNTAMIKNIQPQVRARLAALENERRYAELLINTYDNIFVFLTSEPREEDSRIEALLRLEENRRLLSMTAVPSPLFAAADALSASGLQKLIDQLLQKNADFLRTDVKTNYRLHTLQP